MITGATDGIGKEFAVQLATKYRMNLILVSRTPEKLKAVRQEICKISFDDWGHLLKFGA